MIVHITEAHNDSEWEEAGLRLMKSVVREGSSVLDVGAHLGAHTIPLARAVGTSGSVIALEPQTALFQLLTANVAINGLWNTRVLNAAAGDSPDKLLIEAYERGELRNYGSESMKQDGIANIAVDVITIDSLELPSLDLLKVSPLFFVCVLQLACQPY